MLLAAESWAQPANDDFTNRIVITGLTNTVTGSNVGATKELGEPNHAGNAGGASVWWTWTAPTNGIVEMDTVGSSFVPLLAVYTGDSVSNLVMVSSDYGSGGIIRGGLFSELTFLGAAGTKYQIAVDGYSGESGNVVLNVQQIPPPANDDFTNRIVITGLTNTVTGSNVSATKETGEPNHAGYPGGASVWWSWTAPTNGIVTMG